MLQKLREIEQLELTYIHNLYPGLWAINNVFFERNPAARVLTPPINTEEEIEVVNKEKGNTEAESETGTAEEDKEEVPEFENKEEEEESVDILAVKYSSAQLGEKAKAAFCEELGKPVLRGHCLH